MPHTGREREAFKPHKLKKDVIYILHTLLQYVLPGKRK
jgi:hypothetical protein